MTDATHSPGPLIIADMRKVRMNSEAIPVAIASGPGSVLPIAWVPSWLNDAPVEAAGNARLLAAAYTSYDRHFGPNAIAAAEADLPGQMVGALEDCRAFVAECVDTDKDDGAFLAHIDALLAKVKRP